MGTQYRDNYPYNIEAPQRVYVQYSQDISFDYSTGKYPLGESFEGFIWETVYNPLPHSYGELQLGKHVWMRWRIGEKDNWTLPIRFTDSFTNIESTTLEQVNGTNQSRFRFIYTLFSGEIIYSEYFTITNGTDGRGILNSHIEDNNLIITYTDGSVEDLGRVVGYDGNGIPVGTTDYNILISLDNEPQWISLISQLNNNLSGTSPIEYNNGIISHLNTNGNKHIPIGGNNGDVLKTDGSGNYTWDTIVSTIPIDDTAGLGDVDLLFSADKVIRLINEIQVSGIKFSVALISDLVSITGMIENDLAVVNEDRWVYKYNGVDWVSFFALDASHNHDDRYYTKTQLNTSLGGGLVHWDNITNLPTFYTDWTIEGNTGSTQISNSETLSIVGSGAINTSLSGNTLTISSSGIGYTPGSGIGISENIIFHLDTSSVTDFTSSGGTVIAGLTFDEFGHTLSRQTINLDTRYSLLAHTHATIVNGLGLTGSDYNGSTGSTWSVDFAGTGVATTAARSDHSHSNSIVSITSTNFLAGTSTATKFTYSDGTQFVNIKLYGTWIGGILANPLVLLATIPAGYIPTFSISQFATYIKTDGSYRDCNLRLGGINDLFPGQIRIGDFTDGGTLESISTSFNYII